MIDNDISKELYDIVSQDNVHDYDKLLQLANLMTIDRCKNNGNIRHVLRMAHQLGREHAIRRLHKEIEKESKSMGVLL